MRIIAGLFRILLGMLIVGSIPTVARALTDVQITASGLATLVLLLIALWQFSKGTIRMLRPAPSSHAGSSLALGAALRRDDMTADEPADLRRRARHEAGHALVAHALGHQIVTVSLQQAGNSGGRTIWRHRRAQTTTSPDHIAVCFAGSVAEHSLPDADVHLSGHDDYKMWQYYALSLSVIDPERRSPADLTAQALSIARDLVTEHSAAVDAITDLLVERTVIPGDDVHHLLTEHGVQASPRD